MTIRENDFNRIDLNLLVVLVVLFRERSVSLAAEKLHLGQPAVSGALARLREMFDDPLFVRSAREMTPTPRAQALIESLLPLMESLQTTLFQSPAFDPATANHTFTLGMADWIEMWLMPDLLAQLRRIAPGLRINVVATDPFADTARLEKDDLDLALSVAKERPAWLHHQTLTTMEFRAVWHPNQLALTSPLTLDEYIRPEHLLVTYRSATTSQLDEKLAQVGLRRSVRYTSPHFSSLPFILHTTPAITTVPAGLAVSWLNYYDLRVSVLPLELPAFDVSLLWHRRREKDPALQWLIGVICEQVKASEKDKKGKLKPAPL